MQTAEKLNLLRAAMRKHNLDAYYIPSADPHQNEYVPDCWQRRRFVSGFTGSAGDLVVTPEWAGLWTDGRYFIQAASELRGSKIELMKIAQPGVPTLSEWLSRSLRPGARVGADPQVVSMTLASEFDRVLAPNGGSLVAVGDNLVDGIWPERPSISDAPARLLPTQYTGANAKQKLQAIRKELKAAGAEALVLTTLDSIAWTFNVRGRDVEYNPVVTAYAIVTLTEATLFLSEGKLSAADRKQLAAVVETKPYEQFASALRSLGTSGKQVWVDPGTTSKWVLELLHGAKLHLATSPVVPMKARKNAVEVEGMRRAHVRDGAAVAKFLHWLERELPKGKLTEISAADRLEQFRAEGDLFQGLSFDTISGWGPHGALPHYRVTPATNVPMKPGALYVVDSGGQYLDGTTDITRTVLLGKSASKEQKDRFTRVLKGHIALARAIFPSGTRGMRLDTLARTPLWEVGLDYNHGTGHGVGAYLNVHEGPQSISWNRDTGWALEPGNILSNEPGYYQAGDYGIRIENLIVVQEERELSAKNGTTWLSFETITLCPIDSRLVEAKLLSPDERKWFNEYHRRVAKELAPFMDAEQKRWLKGACAAI